MRSLTRLLATVVSFSLVERLEASDAAAACAYRMNIIAFQLVLTVLVLRTYVTSQCVAQLVHSSNLAIIRRYIC